ncbi:MAG: prolyl-tRNA synthetase associated domain-containing protein [Bacteroidales bacterium]|nr:prolyl-tRNA synthetase associated domain-containing protein [Bacteroidales bacterium]MCU0408403.1 prolyl-tRNA synthetase associated domain-containing protein [Bacteroidales bacterium]
MRGQKELYELLGRLNISYEYYEHPPVATIEDAKIHWRDYDSGRCKNIFFRNHKGNRHYLVVLEHLAQLNIRDLEQRLHQGKLTFASDKRLMEHLGVEPGSVSPFGLINDKTHNVHLFLDMELQKFSRLAFHPNINTATLVISAGDLLRFLEANGSSYEFITLY